MHPSAALTCAAVAIALYDALGQLAAQVSARCKFLMVMVRKDKVVVWFRNVAPRQCVQNSQVEHINQGNPSSNTLGNWSSGMIPA